MVLRVSSHFVCRTTTECGSQHSTKFSKREMLQVKYIDMFFWNPISNWNQRSHLLKACDSSVNLGHIFPEHLWKVSKTSFPLLDVVNLETSLSCFSALPYSSCIGMENSYLNDTCPLFSSFIPMLDITSRFNFVLVCSYRHAFTIHLFNYQNFFFVIETAIIPASNLLLHQLILSGYFPSLCQ